MSIDFLHVCITYVNLCLEQTSMKSCNSCKFFYQKLGNNNGYYCKKHPIEPIVEYDFIKGTKEILNVPYERCEKFNNDGQCKDYRIPYLKILGYIFMEIFLCPATWISISFILAYNYMKFPK